MIPAQQPQDGPEKFDPVMIRMPSDLHTAIKEKAQAEERSMAGTIRHALREYVGQT